MEANPSVTPSAKILAFPTTNPCSGCGRQCADDELSQCLRRGARYCERAECWECQCDRDALEMVQRAHLLTGPPIQEPAEENVLALAFIRQQFGGELCE
jgi:hypothetical protein